MRSAEASVSDHIIAQFLPLPYLGFFPPHPWDPENSNKLPVHKPKTQRACFPWKPTCNNLKSWTYPILNLLILDIN